MAITKQKDVLLNAVSVTPGGTKATPNAIGTHTAKDITKDYGDILLIKLQNGATGPTIAASATVYTSGDGINWYELTTLPGSLEAYNSTTLQGLVSYDIKLGIEEMFVKVDIWGNTGQNVTATVEIQRVISI